MTDHLERNVKELLSRAEAELSMPSEARRRALRALLEESREECPVADRPLRGTSEGRRWWWLSAAAVALLVVGAFLWPGSLENGVAWADVVRHLSHVETLVARITTESTTPEGKTLTTRAVLYQKDPGLSRSETYSASPGPGDGPGGWPADPRAATSIVIVSRGETEATILRLLPRERLAYRTHLTFTGDAAEARAAVPRDMVADSWSRLAGITADRTRRIGERTMDGVRVTGFEADIRDVLGDPRSSSVEGVMRIWADAASGAAREVEAEYRDEAGGQHRTRIENLEWNAPLDDGLFRVPEGDGWRVVEVREEPEVFARTSFRDGVTLTVTPPGGPAVLTEADIEAVVSAQTSWPPGEARPRTMLFLLATPTGEEKLRTYTSGHLGEWLDLDFNGEVRYRIRIGGIIGRRLQLDITPLGMAPAEFEATYLGG